MNASLLRSVASVTSLLIAVFLTTAGCKPIPPETKQANGQESKSAKTQAAAESAGAADAELPPDARPKPLSDEELAEGWIALFDGHSLFGWTAQSKANWRVEYGAIVVDSGDKGLLTTNSQFGDYLLRLEFQADPQTNSGVFLHTPVTIGPEGVAKECYELNIAPPDNPFPTGSFVQRQKAEGVEPREGWRSYEVHLEGGGRDGDTRWPESA